LKINVVLMVFIMVGFAGFKFLFLQSQLEAGEEDECSFNAVQMSNCFLSIGVNCQDEDGDYQIIQNNTVCINYSEFSEVDGNCVVGNNTEVNDLVECFVFIGNIVVTSVKLVISVILMIVALIVDILLIVAMYLLLTFTTVEGAPFIIDFLITTPLIIMNILVIIAFFPGGSE
jgi:hypothetical protein